MSAFTLKVKCGDIKNITVIKQHLVTYTNLSIQERIKDLLGWF